MPSYHQAFSVLTEAKEEDERKRTTLHQFYEETEDCLNSMDSKVRILLEQNIGNLKDKIAMNKRDLKQKDYIVLVAGRLRKKLFVRRRLLVFSLSNQRAEEHIALEATAYR